MSSFFEKNKKVHFNIISFQAHFNFSGLSSSQCNPKRRVNFIRKFKWRFQRKKSLRLAKQKWNFYGWSFIKNSKSAIKTTSSFQVNLWFVFQTKK